MYITYSLLLALALLVSLPWWALQVLLRRKYRAGLAERLGFVPDRIAQTGGKGSIWIHAVSVGEVLAVGGLVQGLQKQYPDHPVFLSTTTATGQRLARERFGQEQVFYFPLDFSFAIRPYLERIRPALLVIAETEFWPNLLRRAKGAGAAVAIVNARISDRSFPRYRRFRRFFSRVLSPIDLFLTQTREDADRLLAIGCPVGHVQVSGNLKFDIVPSGRSKLVEDLRRVKGSSSSFPVVVCGSTTEGEEELLLDAFQQIRQQWPSAIMIVAPRHPERFDKVVGLVAARGLPLIRRSRWDGSPVSGCVFLLDTLGELASVYALADLAFVGGSLFPVGGHNILEPAQHGVAVMTGPHTENFREIINIFAAGGGLKAVTSQDLTRQIMDLLRDEAARKHIGDQARELFSRYTGATARTLEAIRPLMRGTQ
ncbi:MAG TPA: 3-deoxy-D-manno-octulosonic acid transferase [Alphaproteobacteria bacterium]|nr:3-deoxy-D-manno-octulosonic acid transferase [Alphaproteobacteria bacterium]